MTAAHLFSLFCSLPLVVQAWLVLVVAVLVAGVWSISRSAGRVVARVDERRIVPRAARAVWCRREWRVRVARRGPQRLIDRQARALLSALESGDDLQEADR